MQGKGVYPADSREEIHQPADEDGNAAVEVGTQYDGHVVYQNIAGNAAAHSGYKGEHDHAEQVELQADTDLRTGDAEGGQADGVGNQESGGKVGAAVALHAQQPGDSEGGEYHNQRISMPEHLRHMSYQRIAHHAAAHGGEQGGDDHAEHVEPLAVADEVAGHGEGGGADDLDEVGGGHKCNFCGILFSGSLLIKEGI